MNFVRITTRAQSTIQQQRKTLQCQRSSSSSSSHLKRELSSYKNTSCINLASFAVNRLMCSRCLWQGQVLVLTFEFQMWKNSGVHVLLHDRPMIVMHLGIKQTMDSCWESFQIEEYCCGNSSEGHCCGNSSICKWPNNAFTFIKYNGWDNWNTQNNWKLNSILKSTKK